MSHVFTRSYNKVVSILDTIAKVKLCLVMLDLECDALVVEIFQSFLKIIRWNRWFMEGLRRHGARQLRIMVAQYQEEDGVGAHCGAI
ncbi:hypothetical protein CFP56_043116 [Quercus suber]|uniref:Uncharacterized protein n=1 Tax=Quercus suber TaxID=58331 RepID=A0AAW0LKR1_QUESU